MSGKIHLSTRSITRFVQAINADTALSEDQVVADLERIVAPTLVLELAALATQNPKNWVSLIEARIEELIQ